MKIKAVLLVVFLLVSLSALQAQSGATEPGMNSVQFDTSGFPLWAKDLRRGEIIAFGSFPFVYFLTNFSVDVFRCANNGWDRKYAPWPFDAAGSIGKTQDERIFTLSIAAGGAILIALVDYGIESYKRSKRDKEIRSLPEGTPIIIRKPLYEEDAPVVPENTVSTPEETGSS